ncbi:hypothetical protein BC938DRAFT_475023 [Jimgerdemannia flammicorona]|uniref:polynucleotide adenylyltransferase n=1 Tax=Jimgerdemannia flammicorona TaxID=994334 RepID=A0A433QS25_9FUNG|nr:hypothetical protein BC938DRAFT_475023 [Jimgerdemannia flammicorona]
MLSWSVWKSTSIMDRLVSTKPRNTIFSHSTLHRQGVPDAFVPIIKMRFSGIPLDISFARLALQRIPEDLTLSDDDILSQTDDISSRSLNGTRDAQAILRLIPSQTTFANALRAIKHWAKRRALYGKPVGFFNGIAWTIIVARVCQLYPNATSAVIVAAVFEFCQNHPWPEPVLLKHITPARPNIKVWNPKIDMQDRADRMPVITPAFPSKCVTHTVTESTQIVLIAELERGRLVRWVVQWRSSGEAVVVAE